MACITPNSPGLHYFGMEVPTTAAYVICVSVAGPALIDLGWSHLPFICLSSGLFYCPPSHLPLWWRVYCRYNGWRKLVQGCSICNGSWPWTVYCASSNGPAPKSYSTR